MMYVYYIDGVETEPSEDKDRVMWDRAKENAKKNHTSLIRRKIYGWDLSKEVTEAYYHGGFMRLDFFVRKGIEPDIF